MGTLGTRARNGKKQAPRGLAHTKTEHPAVAKLAAALREHKASLEQQAATAEILRGMSSSPGDAQPVFEAIVEKAHRLCDASYSVLYRYDGNLIHFAAAKDVNLKAIQALRTRFPQQPDRGKIVGRAILDRRTFHTPDIGKDRRFPASHQLFTRRAVVSVPLLRENAVLGVISCGRAQPTAFSKKEVWLLKTFADQAVIAIENAGLFNETREALERQTAIADILGVIASSPTNIEPVLQAVAEAASRLCRAPDVFIRLVQGDLMPAVVHVGPIPVPEGAKSQRIATTTPAGQAILECRPIHIPDTTDPGVRAQYPDALFLHRTDNFKSLLIVPLVREGRAIGTITIRRPESGPFSPAQIKLLQTFADQAVIAIENARLFNDTREALERQTATAEILKIISSSPTDVQPVFDGIAKNAMRLFGAASAVVTRRIGEELHLAAFTTTSKSGDETIKAQFPVPLSDVSRQHVRAALAKAPRYTTDTEAPEATASARRMGRARGYRSSLVVPMMRDGEAVGTIAIARRVPGAFSQHQIDLLTTFADQAVIAIENVRLFNETKEALEHQKASAEVLSIVAGSVENTDPVFEAITTVGMKLVPGARVSLTLLKDGQVHYLSHSGVSAERRAQVAKHFPLPIDGPRTVAIATILDSRVLHLPDVEGVGKELEAAIRIARSSGYRAILSVPLMREGKAIGTIAVTREQPGAFSDKEIDLVKTFADQAVIAIQNARMFREIEERNAELKQALERQTATSEILRVISRSPADLRPVFDAISRHFTSLCGAQFSTVFTYDGELVHYAGGAGFTPERERIHRAKYPVRVDDPSVVSARTVVTRDVVHVHDTLTDAHYEANRAAALGTRRILGVPLLRDGVPLGAMVAGWTEPGATPKQHEDVLRTFADQAVIAIENVRLFNETKDALERQTATAEILKIISSSPTDVQPVFDGIAKSALQLLGAHTAVVTRVVGDMQHLAAFTATGPAGDEALKKLYPARIGDLNSGVAILTRAPAFRTDTETDPTLSPVARENARARGWRSVIAVPMLRDGVAIGSINVSRREPGLFSKHQIDLLTTFADQAVIAIENVRLFNETKESLEQQTAISEVLRVISSSPTDVKPVLEAVAVRAARICDAADSRIFLVEGQHYRNAAGFGEVGVITGVIPLNRDTPSGRAIVDRTPQHIEDITALPADELPLGREIAARSGWRTILTVPLLREDRALGTIVLRRKEVRRFSDQQIALLKTFADQAAIAIENVRLFNETKEALEQQTATSNILSVISSSPTDLAPVFDAILKSALELCEAHLGHLNLYDGEHHRTVAHRGGSADFGKYLSERGPYKPGPTLTRVAAERRPVQVPDMRQARGYLEGKPETVKLVELGGARTALHVPLVKEDKTIGVMVIYRPEVQPFTEKQVALVSLFANQAVIAIENVRLFNETKEALEHQEASADILRIVASSVENTDPVFAAITSAGMRLFPGLRVSLSLARDGQVHYVSHSGISEERRAETAKLFPRPLDRDTVIAASIVDSRIVHVPDISVVADKYPVSAKTSGVSGWTAMLAVPLLENGKAIGSLGMSRATPGPFSDKQISLAQTFADQAVIAIRNARLFNETKEALEQQTATAEILKVISASPTDVQPVFDTIVRNSVRLCGGAWGALFTLDNGMVHLGAQMMPDAEVAEMFRINFPKRVDDPMPSAVAIRERRVVNVRDILATDSAPDVKDRARAVGYRSVLTVPMMRGDTPIGAISVTRREACAFSEPYVSLLQTFADQAVIAIGNVRLFNELRSTNASLREALEQQTATSELLKVIGRSNFDLQPVFQTLVENAVRLCGAERGFVFRFDGKLLRYTVGHNVSPELREFFERNPITPGRDSNAGRAAMERRTVHNHDVLSDPEYSYGGARVDPYRTVLAVPMFRADELLGVIVIYRHEVRPFTVDQIALMETFADQAAIAIENVRLFNETTEALEQQKASAEVLGTISSSIADTKPVFDKIVESCARLFDGHQIGILLAAEDGLARVVAYVGDKAGDLQPVPITDESATGRAILRRQVLHIPDIVQGVDVPAHLRPNAARFGIKAGLFAPMLWEGRGLGCIYVGRKTVGSFSEKEIRLLKTFADQAVIAIQNVRLFNELQQRTEALTKSVDQLTALGEVGRAISSTLDLETVLQTIVSRAVQLTRLDTGAVYEYDERLEEFHLRAAENMSEDMVQLLRATPIRKGDGAVGGTAVSREPIEVPETRDESYKSRLREVMSRTGRRALLAVPLMRDAQIIGALAVSRNTPGPFAPEVVELLKTFATQSAMAIQNARLFREIAEKGKQLEIASRHKSHFLASMSHELRTPLNALIGFNELILGDVYGEVPGDMKPPLEQMQSSGKHLLRLINNVLDLAKIEAGRMELALADYSVHDVVENVRSTLQPLAQEKGLELVAQVPDDIPLAHGDAGRITQCLMNLAGNSLKFTKAGQVEISVVLNETQLHYRVADTGIGIPPEKIDSLFTEFKQTDATIASEYGGTGLGLSISKKFVELHGGRIWVESQVGKGSAFSFEVPLRAGA